MSDLEYRHDSASRTQKVGSKFFPDQLASDEQTPVQEPDPEQDFGNFWPEQEWIRILVF